MSFRKRNIGISQAGSDNAPSKPVVLSIPGTKPSPLTGTTTTSTGTSSLDKLLGLGAGLALGTSLLIEEDGTTDFSSALLRCYAAEGVLQSHAVLVMASEGSMMLPGVVEEKEEGKKREDKEGERMKIAWRYERLGVGGEERRGPIPRSTTGREGDESVTQPFCHTFDQTKRLTIPQTSKPITYLTPSTLPTISPFTDILEKLNSHLANTSVPTRLIIPTLLSPLIYPPQTSNPQILISFLHTIRSLLRTYTTLTVIVSYPLSLYPRHMPLTRWAEHLSDGVLQLLPFPHAFSTDASPSSSSSNKNEEKMQGLLKVLKVPVLSERGVGVGGGEDMAFAISRRKFDIRPFHLPPMEVEDEGGGGMTADAKSLEF